LTRKFPASNCPKTPFVPLFQEFERALLGLRLKLGDRNAFRSLFNGNGTLGGPREVWTALGGSRRALSIGIQGAVTVRFWEVLILSFSFLVPIKVSKRAG